MNCMLANQTPLPALLHPYRDHLGQSHVLVVVKACWRLSTGRMAPAEQQVGLQMQPVRMRLGDLALDRAQELALKSRLDQEVVWRDHDLAPPKPAFDVLIAGYATAPPNHPQLFIDAGLRIGTHVHSVRAFAPRYWHPGWIGYQAKPLAPAVRRVPLSYALADWSEGFAIAPSGAAGANDTPACLPWLEAPHTPSRRNKHPRVPAGPGFWPENAAHRAIHTGTYDDAWQRERSPDLPSNFNPRFYNAAHPELQLAQAPAAGTPIRLVHLAQQAIIDCSFPALGLSVQARTASGHTHAPQALKPDTLIIEADQDRFSVLWRILLPAGAQQNALRNVRLFKTGSQAA